MLRILQKPIFHLATHNYEASNGDELNLKREQVVVSSNENNGGWSYGYSYKWHGWFPLNYVVPIDDNFSSKNSYKTDASFENCESYKSAVEVILCKEKQFITDYKSSYEKFVQTLTSKTISSKLDSSRILRECEKFIRIYYTFVTNLGEEIRKPPHKQRVGFIYMEHFMAVRLFSLNYCQIHPFFISRVIRNKKEIEMSYSNKTINVNVVAITKFLSVIFTRPSSYSPFLEELLNYISSDTMAYIEIQMSIAAFNILTCGCAEVRKTYTIVNDILPILEPYLSKDLENKKELSDTIVHIERVVPIDTEDSDSLEHFFVFHQKILFHVTSDINLQDSFKILEMFDVENTVMESVKISEDVFNVIYVSCPNDNTSVKVMTETSDAQSLMLHVWRLLKNEKRYHPFWVTTESHPPSNVPRLSIQSQKQRPARLNLPIPQKNSQIANSVEYGMLKELVAKLRPDSQTAKENNVENNTANQQYIELNKRLKKLEQSLEDISIKLREEQQRRKNLEDAVVHITRIMSSNNDI